ncbi:MAG TPA: alpha/beta hydrolase [Polyangiaceae bacterium]|nr:alpha/beta hydrolase [Polyangiaceae bacterium]
MARTRVLVIPGFGGSGPDHWQTLWEKKYGYQRVEQDDWDHPEPGSWLRRLDEVVNESDEPVALVAHSLGCVLLAHWAPKAPASRVVGALAVAPADVDSPMHTPDEVRCFAPLPVAALPFPSIVVASRTDPYVRFARAEQIARGWGARLVDVGRLGHINADTDVRDWPEGHRLLEELLAAPR